MIRRPVHEVVVQLPAGCQNESIVDERAADVLLHLRRVKADLLFDSDGLIGGNQDRTDRRAFAVIRAGRACNLPVSRRDAAVVVHIKPNSSLGLFRMRNPAIIG